MSKKTKTGDYCLKIDVDHNYWTLQKTIYDYYYNKDKVDSEVCSISPRGRSKIWISSSGNIRSFTDKEIKTYFSKNEMSLLTQSIVAKRHKKNPHVYYYYSNNIDNLVKLITSNISEDCIKLIETLRKIKIQYSHKIK